MAYRAERIEGVMTTGEARSLAAMACGVSPENAETFAVVVFAHVGPNNHDLLVSSNLADSMPLFVGLFTMVLGTSDHLKENGPPLVNSSKIKVLVTHIRMRWPWSWLNG